MAFSSILPVAAIFALYYVYSMPRRLALVAAFTAAFSIILGLVTNGPMVDVFSASAASVELFQISSIVTNKCSDLRPYRLYLLELQMLLFLGDLSQECVKIYEIKV